MRSRLIPLIVVSLFIFIALRLFVDERRIESLEADQVKLISIESSLASASKENSDAIATQGDAVKELGSTLLKNLEAQDGLNKSVADYIVTSSKAIQEISR